MGVGEPNPQALDLLARPPPGLHEAMINPTTGKSYGYNVGARMGQAGMFTPTPNAQIQNIAPGDPNYNLWASYRMAQSPASIAGIQNFMNQGGTFKLQQGELESAQRWAQSNNITIIVQGSLITERDLINKVSIAIVDDAMNKGAK